MNSLFTIGYSSYQISSFLSTLKQNKILALIDVRSDPYSKFKQEFNTTNLKRILNQNKIYYLPLGDSLGARSNDSHCYIGNMADYNLISKTDSFKRSTERIVKGLERFNVVLMCAELDPVNCHRNILICRNLRNRVNKIFHILNDGKIENNVVTEKRLLNMYSLQQNDLFESYTERLEEAYDRRSLEIAYKRDEKNKDA